MAHFNQGRADGNILLGVEEDRTDFRLGDGCHDGEDDLEIGEDRAVQSGSRPDGERGCSVAQIIIARRKNALFGMNEIRCFTVNVEKNVASVKTDDGVWLYGSVVNQHFRLFDSVGCGRSLLGADFVKLDEHGGIDGV